jgi:putative transcriptional regulator
MDDEDFEGLMQGLNEARAYAQGKTVAGLRVHVPAQLDVATIRKRAGLSQARFAATVGVPPGTLKNWEQGRRTPEGPARVLLAMLDKNPSLVSEVLGTVGTPKTRPQMVVRTGRGYAQENARATATSPRRVGVRSKG